MPQMPREDLDHILCLQLVLAWAGESPVEDDGRLGWWKTDLLHPDAGLTLYQQLFPRTAAWAALCGAREAARRVDQGARAGASRDTGFLTLFSLGTAVDEGLGERIAEHRRSGLAPSAALPALFPMELPLDRGALAGWLTRAEVRFETSPHGRRLRGTPPETLRQAVDGMASAIRSLPGTWKAPHYRLKS